MNICMTYIDAVRGDISSLKNNSFRDTELEKFFKKNGGTYFKNAYTIAPDTQRACGTIITGRYPKFNGNIQIGGITKVFLKKDIPNMFDYLLKKNFEIFVVVQPYFKFFDSLGENKKVNYYYDYKEANIEFKKSTSKNKLMFYYIFEYHEFLYENTLKQEKFARNKVGNIVVNLFNHIGKENFDKIVIFSDHGITLREDEVNSYYSLKDFKTNIILYLKDKQDKDLKIDSKLVSLLDIMPTLTEWLEEEKKYKFDGFSLNSVERRKLYMETGHTNYDGFFLPEKEVIENYSIGVKSDKEFKIYKIFDLEKLENTVEWDHILKYTVYAELFNNIYKNLLIREKNIKKDYKEMGVKGEKKIYDTKWNQVKYVDGSLIRKKDLYKHKSNYIELKNNIKRMKVIKTSLIFLLKESIKIILAYLYLLNFYIELKDKWRNKCGK